MATSWPPRRTARCVSGHATTRGTVAVYKIIFSLLLCCVLPDCVVYVCLYFYYYCIICMIVYCLIVLCFVLIVHLVRSSMNVSFFLIVGKRLWR
jgi:hypothetical protein